MRGAPPGSGVFWWGGIVLFKPELRSVCNVLFFVSVDRPSQVRSSQIGVATRFAFFLRAKM